MKNLKKVLALVLVVATLMSFATVASAKFTDADKVTKTEAVDVLSELGIIKGYTDGSFKPEGDVTRAEMAKMVTMLISGGEDVGSLYAGANVFSDCTSHWAKGYIAYANKMGIVAGVGGGKFNPNGNVTGAQAAKMMLVALGYKADIEGYTGSQWSVNVLADARDAGLLKGIEDVNMAAPLTREDAAQMMLNTLEATMVEYEGGTNITTGDGTSIVVDAKRDYVANNNGGYKTAPTPNDAFMQFCEKYFSKLTFTVVGSGDDFGRPADRWSYNGKAIGTYASKEPVAVWTTGIEDVTSGDIYKALNLSATTALDLYANGVDTNADVTAIKGGTDKPLSNYKGATVEAYDRSGDDVVDTLIMSYGYLGKVTKVTEATASADRKVTLTVWNGTTGSAITGVTYETDKFAKDDYVMVYPGDKMSTTAGWSSTQMTADILKVEAATSVSGKISSVSGVNGSAVTALTVDGTKYTVGADRLATNGLTDSATLVKASSYGFNSNYTLFLSNGYVIGVEGESVATEISNIVYVTAPAFQQTDEYGTGTYYVQTIKLDGTVENVKISNQTGSNAGKDNQGNAFAAGFYVKTQNATDSKLWDLVPSSAYGAINNTTVYYGTDTTTATAQNMKEDTKTLALAGANKGYITSGTRVIFVDGSLGSLTTSMATGALKQTIGASSKVLLSKDSDGNYVVEAIIVAAKKVDVSDEVVYIDNTPKGTNANGTEYNMYNITTGEKTVITAAASLSVNGFATYSIDENGVYSFSAVANPNSDNADGIHVLTAAVTKYGTLLTEDDNTDCNLKDIEAADAVIINNTGVADNDGLSLSDVADATALSATAYVVDEAVVAIVVNSITKAA